jgi:hypothetical protein
MFCRSIGAAEGHFLKKSDTGALSSVTSVGIDKVFNDEFNAASMKAKEDPSPAHEALRRKEVIAVVDINKDPSVPAWFMDLMGKYKFNSMVAVPLLGQDSVIGILCAYYHDVCLFDQNTLAHLMMMGRMVGAGMEKSMRADRAVSLDRKDQVVDEFLKILADRPLNQMQLFQLLAKIIVPIFPVKAVVCGPVRKSAEGTSLTLVGGVGVSSTVLSNRYTLPPIVVKRLGKGNGSPDLGSLNSSQWGALKPLIHFPTTRGLCYPLTKQKKVLGAVLGWSNSATPFIEDDLLLFARLARIAALGLNLITK